MGRIPDETNDAFIAAGFYRTLQPRCFGGYEFDLPAFIRVMMEISRGCSESAWVLALTTGHAAVMAGFPEEGQREAFGDRGEFRVPGTSAATKTAPLGRYFRNLAVIRTHITLQLDHTAVNAGRLRFGLPALSRL